ncbi:hypothetical protein AVEN_5621-1 [Araneus ventricosus]|uniref:Transposable element Tcb2 transposase n=1 Tax=Araneus ventricosus TaxID=182803 RepID=A0A4Y2P3F3_ARAVE|nr:hypothetical protein AVEN_5621-1 [Araneus ventricosus]
MMIGSSVDYVRSGGMRNVPVTKAVEHLYATSAKFSECVILASRPAYSYPPRRNRRDLTSSTTMPHPKGIMVWMGISANGVIRPRFVQPGAKINSVYYIQKILNPFLTDDYCRLYPNGDAVFHQGSAPSHASRVTQKFLTDQQVQFQKPQQWLPNNPGATPCDYFLWGHLKNKLNKRRVSKLRCLQKAIREDVKKIPLEMILRALESCPKRCRQIYYAEGRYIEKHR